MRRSRCGTKSDSTNLRGNMREEPDRERELEPVMSCPRIVVVERRSKPNAERYAAFTPAAAGTAVGRSVKAETK